MNPICSARFPLVRKVNAMTAETKIVYPNTSALIATEGPDFPSFLFSERELHKAVDNKGPAEILIKTMDGALVCNPRHLPGCERLQ